MFTNYMGEALKQAEKARDCSEVPVGAVIVKGSEIIASAHNLVRTLHSPIAHAEILVIQQASIILRSERLSGCDLYVTLEPCMMCAGAISLSRIRRLYFGAKDIKGGAVTSGVQFFKSSTCHHKPEIYDGILEQPCSKILTDFFREK